MTDSPENQNPVSGLNYSTLWSNIEREATRKFIQYVSRREFIRLLGTGAAAAALISWRGQSQAARQTRAERARFIARQQSTQRGTLPNGIASGDTTQTSTVLWTRSTEAGTVTFEIATDEKFTNIVQTRADEATDPTLPVKVLVDGLTPATAYVYRVTDAAGTILTGKFRTPAAIGEKVALRFGVSGDWRGELRPYVSVKNAVERDLEFFVELGDSIYADIPSLDFPGEQAVTVEDFRIKHMEVYTDRYGQNILADLRAATSVLATIDDHEVTNDFAGGAPVSTDKRFAKFAGERINQTELYRNGIQVFQEFNPLHDQIYEGTDDPRMEGLPKLYRYVTYGSTAAVIVLDARSFRDDPVPQASPLVLFSAQARTTHRAAMFAEGRTMLGRQQIEDLKRDLLAAQEAGISWKFVMLPEPAQTTGWFGGNDRWEGYALERTEVMRFIEENKIQNVVFVAADIHTTFINSLAYQTDPESELKPIPAFEISTGSVAFYPPTGMAVVDGAAQFSLIAKEDYEAYQQSSIAEKDLTLLGLFTKYVTQLEGYPDLGLEDSGLDFELLKGTYVAGHTFGWTEFDIEADSQLLTVTTYGVPAYDAETAANAKDTVLALEPEIVSQFRVKPKAAR